MEKQIKAFIVYNAFSQTDSLKHKINRLLEESTKLNIKFDLYSTNNFNFYYKNGEIYIDELENTQYSFCIFLDKDKYLSEALEKYTKVFNSPKSIFLCDDKMTTYQALNHIKNLITPKVIPSLLCYSETIDILQKKLFLDKVEKNINYPLICKQSFGSLGKQVYLIHNRDELNKIFDKLAKLPHLYMDYIDYEKGTDYRVITVGNKVISVIKRSNPNDFRSNIALGGKGELSSIPKEVEKTIIDIVKRLDLIYSGIDIIKLNNKQYALLEVNSNAYFEEAERVSKINIAYLFLQEILNKINS